MAIKLSDKNVGDIVKINEDGVAVNFIIVHKGLPSDMYDSSCDGVWLLRETAHSSRTVNTQRNNDYENSEIKAWLNGEYLNSMEPQIRNAIKQVKIPYKKGTGISSTGVQSGADGLSCKVFLLSCREVGFTADLPDGALLSYFMSSTDTEANAKRICKDGSGSAVDWWLRSASSNLATTMWRVMANGGQSNNCYVTFTHGTRPAFVVPASLLVAPDGTVSANTLPTITSDKTGDLGALNSGFTCNYSVNDEDEEDSLTVTLTLDDVQLDQFAAEKSGQYSYTLGGSEWLRITEGEHTFGIGVFDGKDTVESTAGFSRHIEKAVVSLEAPLEADDVIRVCSLFVRGSLPMDTELQCEVTNNGNDEEPVWEDCTVKVKAGVPYVFKNKVAENGFAFNFRVTAKRGLSDIGGYITEVSGGFE